MPNNPVFVKIEDYKEALGIINTLKKKLKEANSTLEKLNDLRNREEAELEQWRSHLREVEKKVNFVDNTLFEPQS